MPELGKYAVEVLSAYGISAVLLFGLIAISLLRSNRVKADLKAVENRKSSDA